MEREDQRVASLIKEMLEGILICEYGDLFEQEIKEKIVEKRKELQKILDNRAKKRK